MKHLTVLPVFALFILWATPQNVCATTLHEAVFKNQVSLTAEAVDDKIEITLKNLLSRAQVIELLPGTVLTSGDEDVQDVLIVEKQNINLPAGTTLTITLKGLCVNADKGSYYGHPLVFSHIADGKLLGISNFIYENNLMDYSAQQAVWVVSDGHDIAGVSHENKVLMTKTREYLSQLTGQPNPWYTKHYEEPDLHDYEAQTVFNDELTLIEGEFLYSLETNEVVTFGIYNEDGELVAQFFENQSRMPGNYTFSFTLESTGISKGTYYARMTSNGKIIVERDIKV